MGQHGGEEFKLENARNVLKTITHWSQMRTPWEPSKGFSSRQTTSGWRYQIGGAPATYEDRPVYTFIAPQYDGEQADDANATFRNFMKNSREKCLPNWAHLPTPRNETAELTPSCNSS